MPQALPIDVRARAKFVERSPDECWPWLGPPSRGGYGIIGRSAPAVGSTLAHRVVYQMYRGPIPAGLALDHTCHNRDAACPGGPTCRHRLCVNPWHLEPATSAENTVRGTSDRRDYCPAGHYRAGLVRRPRGQGRRYCMTCAAERQAEIRKLRGEGALPDPRPIDCVSCGQIQPLCARNLCRRCYTYWYRRHFIGLGRRPGHDRLDS